MNAPPAALAVTDETLIASGRAVIDIEAQALEAVKGRLGADFAAACRHILACRGRVVCTGMGKSGHIGNKIAATLASTGTPAFFMHPGEASHGDLGMVTDADLVLALSNSGESDEILAIVPALKRQGNLVIGGLGVDAADGSKVTVTLPSWASRSTPKTHWVTSCSSTCQRSAKLLLQKKSPGWSSRSKPLPTCTCLPVAKSSRSTKPCAQIRRWPTPTPWARAGFSKSN